MILDYIQVFENNPYLGYFLCIIFFLCIGSFLNVVIVRLPQMILEEFEDNAKIFLKLPVVISKPKLNLVSIRSRCVFCKNKIKFWHNIPVVSFCLLRGRCNHCAKKISWIYPFVEILTVVVSISAVFYFGYNLKCLYVLLFIWIIICLSAIDIKYKLLPDSLTLGLLWLGILANIDGLYTNLPEAIYGAVFGYLSLWLFINIYYLITGKVGMGGGDFKLFAALGAWFGVYDLTYILIIASVLGIICATLYIMVFKKSYATAVPFGPFLAISGVIFLFEPLNSTL